MPGEIMNEKAASIVLGAITLAMVACLIFWLGFSNGKDVGRREGEVSVRQEAAFHGFGRFAFDEMVGEVRFQWKRRWDQ